MLSAKGSFTVELALLMPVLFWVIMTCVCFGFHVHNRACLRARCAEQAVSGKQQELPPLYGAGETERGWIDNNAFRTVSASSSTFMYGSADAGKIREECRYCKVKPVRFTRKAHAVIELSEGE